MPANLGGSTSGPSDIEPHIATVCPAQSLQRLYEGGNAGLLVLVWRRIHEHADAPHPLALLSARRQRPSNRRAAQERDELSASDHSITSSAVESNVSGTVRSSILAAFRL